MHGRSAPKPCRHAVPGTVYHLLATPIIIIVRTANCFGFAHRGCHPFSGIVFSNNGEGATVAVERSVLVRKISRPNIPSKIPPYVLFGGDKPSGCGEIVSAKNDRFGVIRELNNDRTSLCVEIKAPCGTYVASISTSMTGKDTNQNTMNSTNNVSLHFC